MKIEKLLKDLNQLKNTIKDIEDSMTGDYNKELFLQGMSMSIGYYVTISYDNNGNEIDLFVGDGDPISLKKEQMDKLIKYYSYVKELM